MENVRNGYNSFVIEIIELKMSTAVTCDRYYAYPPKEGVKGVCLHRGVRRMRGGPTPAASPGRGPHATEFVFSLTFRLICQIISGFYYETHRTVWQKIRLSLDL